jgi:hypothetical protein
MKVTGPNFIQIPNEFLFGLGAKKMDAMEMMIYIYLAARCFGDKGSAFPTQSTIAKDLGLALSTVEENIKSMKIRGVIKVPSTSRGGKAKWNTYTLTHWDKIIDLPDYYDCRRKRNNTPPNRVIAIPAKQGLQPPPNRDCNPRQTDINNTKEEYKLKNTNSSEELFSDTLEPEPTDSLEHEGEATDTTKALSQKNRQMLEDTIISWFDENFPGKNHVPNAFRAASFSMDTLQSFWKYRDTWCHWRTAEKTDRSILIAKANMHRFIKEMKDEQLAWDSQNAQSRMDAEDRRISIKALDAANIWTNRYVPDWDSEDINIRRAVRKIMDNANVLPSWIQWWCSNQQHFEGRENGIFFNNIKMPDKYVTAMTRDNILDTLIKAGLWTDDDYYKEEE